MSKRLSQRDDGGLLLALRRSTQTVFRSLQDTAPNFPVAKAGRAAMRDIAINVRTQAALRDIGMNEFSVTLRYSQGKIM